jgi:pyruvate kinase
MGNGPFDTYIIARMVPKTKIVCTLGPASQSPEVLDALVAAGMDVARVNFSHGTPESNRRLIRDARLAAQRAGRNLAILQDLAGPKIRIGELPAEGVRLAAGDHVRLAADGGFDPRGPVLPLPHPRVLAEVPEGALLRLDDGRLELVVERRTGEGLDCRVVSGGLLESRKGVSFPGLSLPERAPTAKDLADLAVGLEEGVDFAALSFVQDGEDLRALARAAGGAPVKLVAKLERGVALDNLADILEASDAVMVARGDLGVETDLAMIPVHQKLIIREANRRCRPVITATQMLESMMRQPLPTRAEVTDVANAIYDGTDAVMLSGETAVGQRPVETLVMMRRIADAVEANLGVDRGWLPSQSEASGPAEAVAQAAWATAERLGARLILAQTLTGRTARLISRYRPRTPVVAVTPRESTRRCLALVWGIHALCLPGLERDFQQTTSRARRLLAEQGLARDGDLLVVLAGMPAGGHTNVLKVEELGAATATATATP